MMAKRYIHPETTLAMMIRTARLAIALFFCVSILIAAQHASARDFVDSAGRHVDVPETITRVLAAGPPAAVALYTLAPDKLAGLVRPFTPAQQAFVPAKVALLPIYGSLNGHGTAAIIDTVRASKANVIVDIGDIDSRYLQIADQVQAAAGIPYVLIDGALAKSADTYRLLGQLIGEPKRAETLADASDAILTSVQQRLADLPIEKRLRVYYGRGPSGLQTGGARSLNLEVIKTSGGINVGDSLDKGGLASVSTEQVVTWNPDVMLMQERSAYDSVVHGDAWSPLTAVHERHVYLVPGAPFGWVEEPPSVNRLMGVRWIAALLYPDRFPEDIGGIVRDFYRTFYQVEPTNTQINALLTDAFRK